MPPTPPDPYSFLHDHTDPLTGAFFEYVIWDEVEVGDLIFFNMTSIYRIYLVERFGKAGRFYGRHTRSNTADYRHERLDKTTRRAVPAIHAVPGQPYTGAAWGP